MDGSNRPRATECRNAAFGLRARREARTVRTFRVSVIYALLGGLSISAILAGGVMLLISLFAAFFWGSGLVWREVKKDRRNGL